MLANAIARKPIVMALDTPVTDQPVSRDMGTRKTGSENMAPIATQLSKPPAATITQRYEELVILSHHCISPCIDSILIEPKTTHDLAQPLYSSLRRHQTPVSLRPLGARSSHGYMPQMASTPRE